MWNARKNFRPEELPDRRVVVQFRFSDEGLDYDTYRALIQPDAPVEICTSIPGFDVDLYVKTNVLSLLGVVLGRTTIARERELDEIIINGDALLERTMDR